MGRISIFWQWTVNGLAAPFTAFNPELEPAVIDDEVLESSYRSADEDGEHIREYFDRAMDLVRPELNPGQQDGSPEEPPSRGS